MTQFRTVSMYYPRAGCGDGGLTNALWCWAASFHAAGLHVEILYDPDAGPLNRSRDWDSVRARAVRHRGRGRLRYPVRLGENLTPGNLLVLNSGYVFYNLVAGRLARRAGQPYLVTPHGAYDPHLRGRKRVRRVIWNRFERSMLTGAAAVHVPFDIEGEHVRDLAPTACTVVAAPAIDLPVSGWAAPADEDGYVSWLGRIDVEHKGLDRLLDAIALLPPAVRPKLRMHGRDYLERRSDLDRMVGERGLSPWVTVDGSVDGTAKQAFLRGASAYVHPARWESYGVALVENLALGVPCLTTRDINLAGDLDRHGAALVVDGSVEGLAEGLRAVSSGAIRGFGSRGRQYVREELAHRTVADSLLAQLRAAGLAAVPS